MNRAKLIEIYIKYTPLLMPLKEYLADPKAPIRIQLLRRKFGSYSRFLKYVEAKKRNAGTPDGKDTKVI